MGGGGGVNNGERCGFMSRGVNKVFVLNTGNGY